MSNNLLQKVSDVKNPCKDFCVLTSNTGFIPAKRIISEVPQSFINKDPNFRKQFQTTEFNQRFWELHLYNALINNDFTVILPSHEFPDFEIEKNGLKVFVEAVSSNPTDNDTISPLLLKGLKSNLVERIKAFIGEQLLNQYSLKISNALYSKLQKEYWKNDWVEGKPLVIAINAFHNPYTSMIPDSKIIEYLYKRKLDITVDIDGNQKSKYTVTNDIEFNTRKKPSGFFNLPNSENISAVMFSNERPIWKFNRMGYTPDDFKEIIISRYGYKYDSDPKALKPAEYSYQLHDTTHKETWEEGISIFHNPNALLPLNRDLFSNFRQIWIEKDDKYGGFMPDFFPFTSMSMLVSNLKD